jgi:hypothetical protein
VSPKFYVQHGDFFETVSLKAGNPAIISHWQKLSVIRFDGKTENVKSRIIRESKSTSKEARVVPAATSEPELFELEEEVPPHVLEEDNPPPIELDTEPKAATTFGPTLRRASRTRRPLAQYQQYLEQQNMAFVSEISEA